MVDEMRRLGCSCGMFLHHLTLSPSSLYLWGAVLTLGPLFMHVKGADGPVHPGETPRYPPRSPPVAVGVPIRFKTLTLFKFPLENLTIIHHAYHAEIPTHKPAVSHNRPRWEVPRDDCKLDLKMTDGCSSLITGSTHSGPSGVEAVKPWCKLQHLLGDCRGFRRAHGYEDKSVTSEELDYPLAFAIKMHTDADQAEQLLRTIYRPHNVYCIHVDRKSAPGVYDTMKSIGKCLRNVFVLEDRETVVYSSSAAVSAELKCMKKLAESNVSWKYYINLAGQEFPLKTNLEIVMILKRLHGANDIESYDQPIYQEWRFKNKFVISGDKLVQTAVAKEPFGHKLQMSKGSAYGMFKREFVNFILTDDVAQRLIQWLNDTSSPEESVWATLNTLPWAPGGTYVETRQMLNTHASRALIWSWYKDTCHGRYIRSVCVFAAGDLHWLTTRPNVIANKFNKNLDNVPMACLERWLHRRETRPLLQTIDKDYVSKLPHVQYYKNLNLEELLPKTLLVKKREWLKKNPWRQF